MNGWAWIGVGVGAYLALSITGAVLLGRMIAVGQGGNSRD